MLETNKKKVSVIFLSHFSFLTSTETHQSNNNKKRRSQTNTKATNFLIPLSRKIVDDINALLELKSGKREKVPRREKRGVRFNQIHIGKKKTLRVFFLCSAGLFFSSFLSFERKKNS